MIDFSTEQKDGHEVWRPVPYTTYEASTEGRIRNRKTGAVLTPALARDGYEFVGVRFLDEKRSVKVHRLVALAFHGAKPAGAECIRHLDGDRRNNRPGNLRWGTLKENAADTILHGRQVCGFDHPNMKITPPEARSIRAAYRSHMARRAKAESGFVLGLAARYPHLTYKTVYRAARGGYDHLLAQIGEANDAL